MANQSEFDQIYMVGDSLSDNGGIFQLSSQLLSLATAGGINTQGLHALPLSPYAGRFSNGPVMAEYTAELLGAELFNFSFGGAQALGTLTFGAVAAPAIPAQALAAIAALPPAQQAQINAVLNKNINLAGQMADFVAATSANEPSDHSALVCLMGLNDLQALAGSANPNNPQAAIAAATQVAAGIVQAYLDAAHTAFDQGIGTAIFVTLPAVSFFPMGKALAPILQTIGDTAVANINQGIQADAAQLRSEGHDVRVVDLAAYTAQISANPSAFGFQNLAQPTLLGVTFDVSPNPAAPPPDQTAFIDAIHATAKLHDLMGQFVATSLGQTAVTAHDDSYIVKQGQVLAPTLPQATGVLANDFNTTTASLLDGPDHGTLQLVGNGTFTYTPAAGFQGVDSFTYQAGNAGPTMDQATVTIHVVPLSAGPTSTTLNLIGLTADEQIAATYAAFFGRAPDAGGHGFWVDQFEANLPTQGASALFANIASSFGISAEAKSLYPFLASPFTASDAQISAFLDSVYNNLFNRSSDAGGLAYWTAQTKATLQAGQFVGSVLINIMSGAQDTAAGQDITTLMDKVAVGLAYVHEQQEHGTVWGAIDGVVATVLLDGVTNGAQTVLTGVKNADVLITAHA
ncbi:Ig-like domain-containing protein [Reyranella sp.]|uniref:Ig-like domain-containing protein n=1 Tax=Reyranella sp. TaxID=1929291 RepID=UPI0037833603